MKRFLLRCRQKGFTLIELLTVVAIIVVLAGLILAGMGYAQQKAAAERARAEISAMSLALESYKIDNGDYPRELFGVTATPATADAFKASTAAPSGNVSVATILYRSLAGDTDGNGTPDSDGKVYFQFKPDMLSTGTAARTGTTHVIDPFGYAYGYSTRANFLTASGTAIPVTGGYPDGYNPTFDLWSTGGQTTGTASARAKWITNW